MLSSKQLSSSLVKYGSSLELGQINSITTWRSVIAAQCQPFCPTITIGSDGKKIVFYRGYYYVYINLVHIKRIGFFPTNLLLSSSNLLSQRICFQCCEIFS